MTFNFYTVYKKHYDDNYWRSNQRKIEIIENSFLIEFCEMNIRRVMIFSHYSVYKKHVDDKNWRSNDRKIASIITSAQIILLSTVDRLVSTNEIFGHTEAGSSCSKSSEHLVM